jgi:hypothetical protein
MRDLLRSGAEIDGSAAAWELERTVSSFHLVRASWEIIPASGHKGHVSARSKPLNLSPPP